MRKGQEQNIPTFCFEMTLSFILKRVYCIIYKVRTFLFVTYCPTTAASLSHPAELLLLLPVARSGAARLRLIPLLSPEFRYVLEQHPSGLSEALGVWGFLPCLCNDLCESCSFSCGTASRTSQTLASRRLPWEIF